MTDNLKRKLEEIENTIRYHYFECECKDKATHEQHCKAILYKIMKIIDYESRGLEMIPT